MQNRAMFADQPQVVAAVFDRAADTYDDVGVVFFKPIADRLVAEHPEPGNVPSTWGAGAARRCSRWPEQLVRRAA